VSTIKYPDAEKTIPVNTRSLTRRGNLSNVLPAWRSIQVKETNMRRTIWSTGLAITDDAPVGIVVVNYNTRDLIAQLIYSLYRQVRQPRFQLVVVDNASTDGSPALHLDPLLVWQAPLDMRDFLPSFAPTSATSRRRL
jgi:hypothetical protein